MTSNFKLEEILAMLVQSGKTFVLMIEEHGSLNYYSNNKGDRLILVDKEE